MAAPLCVLFRPSWHHTPTFAIQMIAMIAKIARFTIIMMIMFGDFSRPKDTRASKSPGLNKDLVS